MSTQLFLPHDDFKSSRKALIISTVFTLIFTKMELAAEKAKIFDLEIIINQNQIVFWSGISTLYLLFMFALNAVEEAKIHKLKQKKDYSAFLGNMKSEMYGLFQDLEERDDAKTHPGEEIIYDTFKGVLSREIDLRFEREFSSVDLKFIIMLVAAPTLLSMYAIISAILRLLS